MLKRIKDQEIFDGKVKVLRNEDARRSIDVIREWLKEKRVGRQMRELGNMNLLRFLYPSIRTFYPNKYDTVVRIQPFFPTTTETATFNPFFYGIEVAFGNDQTTDLLFVRINETSCQVKTSKATKKPITLNFDKATCRFCRNEGVDPDCYTCLKTKKNVRTWLRERLKVNGIVYSFNFKTFFLGICLIFKSSHLEMSPFSLIASIFWSFESFLYFSTNSNKAVRSREFGSSFLTFA